MNIKQFFSFLFTLIIFLLFLFYLLPLNTTNFVNKSTNNNFSLSDEETMQFYSNLRYKNKEIFYQIQNCPIAKKENMIESFKILENSTILKFNPTEIDPELSINCEERTRYNNGLFIAGEGGVTNVTSSGDFNIILNGEVLLIRKSSCFHPNIAIHELLHALGFKHSSNKNNILYEITECDQTISQDIFDKINSLYSIPTYPDLVLMNSSANLNGRFLNLEFVVMNYGLEDSSDFKLIVSSDKKILKEMNLTSLEFGTGKFVKVNNIWVSQLDTKEINLEIQSNFNELSKLNNKIKLEIID